VTSRALLLDVVVRGLHPFMIFVSVMLLLRGHDAPGGGFIGGLVAVAATALLTVARGHRQALARLPLAPVPLAALGALLSLGSGVPALWAGEPFLTHLWVEAPVGPWLVPLSTVHLFDVGVYATVWGALGGLAAAIIAVDEEGAA